MKSASGPGATLLRVPSAVPNDPPSTLPNRFRPAELHLFRHVDLQRSDGNTSRFEAPAPPPESARGSGAARSPEPTTLSQRREIG